MWTFYKSENYVSHPDTRKGLINQLYHRVRTIMPSRKQGLLEKYTRLRKGKLLDIGCGTGYFIHHMQKAGWEVHGVEPDAAARKLAEELTGQPISATECLFQLDNAGADVITKWHVLEHVASRRASGKDRVGRDR